MMTEKKKIVLFYSGIAALAGLLIFGFLLLGDLRKKRSSATESKREGIVRGVQVQGLEEGIGQYKFLEVKEDFTAVNQFGEEVTIQSLKGKVWVFAQFYGSCPECRSTNLGILKELYDKYNGNKNFQIVTISVKPEKDAVTLMKALADFYAKDAKDWWFISADAKEVNAYCQANMGYMAFKKNEKFGKEVPGSEEAELEIHHDMGISVFGPEMGMWAKVDIAAAMKAKDDLRIEVARKKIDLTIEWALKQIKN